MSFPLFATLLIFASVLPYTLASPMPSLHESYSYSWTARVLPPVQASKRSFLSGGTGSILDGSAGNLLGGGTANLASADYLGLLRGYQRSAAEHASILDALAVRSSSVRPNDAEFEKGSASALTDMYGDFLNSRDLLKSLGAEKGLANYDRDIELETLLKDLVNSQKNALKSIDTIVFRLPFLGQSLGPIVYDIKCILDDVLNAVENISDKIINDLEPLLHSVIGSSVQSACKYGIDLGVICL